MVIIFESNNNISIVTPTPFEQSGLTIEEVAVKAVPNDIKYWIVDEVLLPTQRPQSLWVINELEDGSIEITIDAVKEHQYEVDLVTVKKDQLYDDALSFINSKQWPSKLALGRLSEKDKSSYNAVLDYMDALDQLDLTTAPDIEWPVSPL
ncbi:tail fiber assembly protein [Erwinia sp. 1181_3]|uniref:tail fiber assembly protein n=1 Tax=Erwinia sp. 1181_3 TaxID=2605957 RepID=UPI0040598835